jgi:SOS response regulatory protein OraA/RecX
MTPRQQAALRAAAGALGRRDLTRAELRDALAGAGTDAEDADWACDWLAGQGLVDDRRVAEREVELGARAKGWGRAKLEARLGARGAEPAAAAEALASLDEGTEAALALQALRKRPGRHRPDSAARFLASRGFTEGAVRSVLDQEFPGWEEGAD